MSLTFFHLCFCRVSQPSVCSVLVDSPSPTPFSVLPANITVPTPVESQGQRASATDFEFAYSRDNSPQPPLTFEDDDVGLGGKSLTPEEQEEAFRRLDELDEIKRLEEETLQEKKRLAEEEKHRLAEEEKKRLAEEEKKRLAEEEKLHLVEEEKRLADQKLRLAEEEKRLAEKRRLSDAKRMCSLYGRAVFHS